MRLKWIGCAVPSKTVWQLLSRFALDALFGSGSSGVRTPPLYRPDSRHDRISFSCVSANGPSHCQGHGYLRRISRIPCYYLR